MFCSISGEVPQAPVISKINGLLFERNLISKILKETGKCPVSGLPMSEDDLLVVNANKSLRPRTINSSSIPSMLTSFQNEWDEVMLETFTLKQHLDATRQELSQALYQHDAACRVIARLMRERDEARALVAALQTNAPAAHSDQGAPIQEERMAVDDESNVTGASQVENVISVEAIAAINDKCKELSSKRKGRKASEHLTSKSVLSSFAQVHSFTSHKADSKTGVTSVAVASRFAFAEESSGNVILSGSTDKTAVLTEQSTGAVLAKLTGHSKKVTAVSFHGADSKALITASADKTVKIWNASSSGKYAESWSYGGHSDEVTGIALHPTGNYLTSVSLDGAWHFLDIVGGRCLKTVAGDAAQQFSSCAFHPDGLILGTATTAGVLKIWDIREQQNVANLAEHSGSINSVSFSENGYLVATGSDDGNVKIWDLRKLACSKTLEMGPGAVSAVSFDYSGTYLAVGGGGEQGHGVQVRVVKDWSSLLTLDSAHSKQVTGVAWTENAASLVTVSLDRTIRTFAASA